MWTLFYESDTKWFDVIANGSIWLIIATFITAMIWIGHDVLTGSSLPTGFTPIGDKITTHKATSNSKTPDNDKTSTSPFAPGKRKLTAKP